MRKILDTRELNRDGSPVMTARAGISFFQVFLFVGLITGWIVETRTTRRLVDDMEKIQRRE